MKQLLFAVTLLVVLGAAATLRLAGASEDIDGLMKADQAFNEATAARGLEGFRSFLAEDVRRSAAPGS